MADVSGMASATTAMLFAPPLPPVQLPQDGEVVIGRGRDCQVRLSDADTSRRHAKIVCAGGRFVLYDLASTNGTFVNGERIEERVLEPGDRLQIGANSVTFCQVATGQSSSDDGARTRPDDAQTVLFDRSVGTEVFRGDLAEIPPFAVLQLLQMGRKTGRLRIDSDATPGSLWLRAGAPIHAETKSQVGFDAAVALVHATSGSFAFEPNAAPPEATIEATVTHLLLEASRQRDEGLC
jgi:pSer/pThr/pTyr-binding forkhead associated (FHA) protein